MSEPTKKSPFASPSARLEGEGRSSRNIENLPQFRSVLDRLDRLEALVYVKGRDVEIGAQPTDKNPRVPRLILRSPDNGKRWWVAIDGTGTPVITEVT